jgi:hypothetical protein
MLRLIKGFLHNPSHFPIRAASTTEAYRVAQADKKSGYGNLTLLRQPRLVSASGRQCASI